MISKRTIEKVFETARVEEIIGDFVQLKKSGSNYKGLSPFTEERTPSFMVSPAKQIWKDFSSGKGGTVITFLMEHEQYTYPEAIKYIANKYNIEVETEILENLLNKSKFHIAEIQIQRSADQIIEDRVRSVSQYNMKFEDYLKAINKTNEEFYKESLDTAELEIKRFLVIEEIIKIEKFSVEEKEILVEVEVIKQQYKDQQIADDETLKNYVRNNLQRKKCLEYLVKSSKKTTSNRKKK